MHQKMAFYNANQQFNIKSLIAQQPTPDTLIIATGWKKTQPSLAFTKTKLNRNISFCFNAAKNASPNNMIARVYM